MTMFRIATFKPKILGLEFGRPICCRHADNNRVPEFNKFQVKNRDCFFFVSFSVNRVRLDEQLELKNIWCCVCVCLFRLVCCTQEVTMNPAVSLEMKGKIFR
jgi:hypothetical protein